MQDIATGVPRLEALRLRDILAEAGIVCVLDPDFGLDMTRPTSVLVDDDQADYARRVIEEADAGVEWVEDDSPAALVERIEEHLDALRGLVGELKAKLDDKEEGPTG